MFTLRASISYHNSLRKLVRSNESIKIRLMSVLKKLSLNPTDSSLQSHKVNTVDHGVCWSSRVTGDIRIIWDYDSSKKLSLILLDIGGHSGSHRVYK